MSNLRSQGKPVPEAPSDLDLKFQQYLQLYESRRPIELVPRARPPQSKQDLLAPKAAAPSPLNYSHLTHKSSSRPLAESDLNARLSELRAKYDIREDRLPRTSGPAMAYSYREGRESNAGESSGHQPLSQRESLIPSRTSISRATPPQQPPLRPREQSSQASRPEQSDASREQDKRALSSRGLDLDQLRKKYSSEREEVGRGQALENLMKVQARIGEMLKQARF